MKEDEFFLSVEVTSFRSLFIILTSVEVFAA